MMKKRAKTFLESIADEVLARFGRLDSILEHAPSKGSYHETILRDVIRNYLPSAFSVGDGFLVNMKSEVSSQMDILVVDNLDPRSFVYKNNEFFIAADIAVVCLGEVKTYCTKKEFTTSCHNLVRNKALISEPSARVTSFIFCYDAYASSKSFAKWIDDAILKLENRDSYDQWHYPNYVFCLKKNIMLERKSIPGGIQYASVSSGRRTNVVQQMILQNLFQCVTDGCSRLRILQGIKEIKG